MFIAYRRLLAEPGVRPLLLVGMLGKMPSLGIASFLILHVVQNLGRGFGQGSLVVACWTAGCGLGAPLQGRRLDRYGLRPVMALLMVMQAVFWTVAPFLSFSALPVVAFVGGLSALPAFTVIRLALAGLVGEEDRHTAYAADAITTDLAYMTGPSTAIMLATLAGPAVAFLTMGGMLLTLGGALLVLDPPLRPAGPAGPRGGDVPEHSSGPSGGDGNAAGVGEPHRLHEPGGIVTGCPESGAGSRPGDSRAEPGRGWCPRSRRPVARPVPGWLNARLACALAATAAVACTAIGFEVAAIGALQQWGELRWSWLLLVAAGSASVVGGLSYGAMRRPPSTFFVTVALGALCVPIGLAGNWFWLCLFSVPANFFVAPALSSSAGAVSRLAPDDSKGVAMGSYAGAILVGNVIGSPLAGSLLDHGGRQTSFIVVGTVTVLITLTAWFFDRRSRESDV